VCAADIACRACCLELDSLGEQVQRQRRVQRHAHGQHVLVQAEAAAVQARVRPVAAALPHEEERRRGALRVERKVLRALVGT
jgi:hypothetical protein